MCAKFLFNGLKIKMIGLEITKSVQKIDKGSLKYLQNIEAVRPVSRRI